MIVHEGTLDARGLRVAIVAGRFNDFIGKELVEGAVGMLRRLGAADDDVELVWVPGAFEIPLAVQAAASSGRFDAVLALGVVIRGSTAHFEHVAGQSAAGIARVQHETQVPCVFGVLTTDTIEQAIERAGTKAGNKGAEAAATAVETVRALQSLRGGN
jgi:6,7-dimethyl-8-ribityllumazine synthase